MPLRMESCLVNMTSLWFVIVIATLCLQPAQLQTRHKKSTQWYYIPKNILQRNQLGSIRETLTCCLPRIPSHQRRSEHDIPNPNIFYSGWYPAFWYLSLFSQLLKYHQRPFHLKSSPSITFDHGKNYASIHPNSSYLEPFSIHPPTTPWWS